MIQSRTKSMSPKRRGRLGASIGDEAYKKQKAEARKLRRHKAKANANSNGTESTNAQIAASQMGSNMVNDLFNNVLSTIPKK